jgi:hypothetical protein
MLIIALAGANHAPPGTVPVLDRWVPCGRSSRKITA